MILCFIYSVCLLSQFHISILHQTSATRREKDAGYNSHPHRVRWGTPVGLEHNADKYSKTFTTWNQFVTLLTAQAKGWNSLREVTTGFKSHESQLYHLGFEKVPTKSTLARVNCNRDAEMYEDFFYLVRDQLQPKLIQKKFDFELHKILRIVDSTTIDLSISFFNWAKFRYNKGAL